MLKEESVIQLIASHKSYMTYWKWSPQLSKIILSMKLMQRAHTFKSRFQGTCKLYVRKYQERQPNLYSDTGKDRLTLSKILHENQCFDLHSVMF